MNEIINSIFQNILINNKIFIPNEIKKVKIDIGTSYNAPWSDSWLSNEKEGLMVFAFEPNTFNISSIKNGFNHLIKNKKFVLIESALSTGSPRIENFYCTENDPGTSSLYQPLAFQTKSIIKVPIIELKDFFNIFPWDQIPFIEHLKIDAQGSDFQILKSAYNYLSEKVIFLDIEITTRNQYNKNEDTQNILKYLEEQNFQMLNFDGLENCTFINKNFLDKDIKYIKCK